MSYEERMQLADEIATHFPFGVEQVYRLLVIANDSRSEVEQALQLAGAMGASIVFAEKFLYAKGQHE